MKYFVALSLAAALQGAVAHTIFQQVNDNGVGNGVRVPDSNSPIQDVTLPEMACNGGANPTKPTTKIIDVAAGSEVTMTWRHVLDGSPSDVIDSSHKGPVTAYMKKVEDATADAGPGDGWFKIAQDGYDGSSWGVDRLIAAGGTQEVTIPACIAPGQYLLRGELLALHSAGSAGGAQFYMECAQINVTGGSGAKTPATVAIPGAYKAEDPGITINIYQQLSGYTVPGPDVFQC